MTQRPSPARRPTAAGSAYDAYQLEIFDGATLFTAITHRGRADYDRREFPDLPSCVEYAAQRDRTVTYAVSYVGAPIGRSIVLDRAHWPRWLERWDRQHPTHLEPETPPVNPTPATAAAPAAPSVFLLHWNGHGPTTCQVERFPDRKLADVYAYEVLPGDRTAHVVATVDDLGPREVLNGPKLIAIHNALTDGALVVKFESLDAARSRVFQVLVRRYSDRPYTELPVTRPTASSETPMTAAATALAPPPAAPAARGRRTTLDLTATIQLKVPSNPCRPGTGHFDRFALYRPGMTVARYVELGGRPGDVRYDVEHGFIELIPAG